jgi:hypothetical protein
VSTPNNSCAQESGAKGSWSAGLTGAAMTLQLAWLQCSLAQVSRIDTFTLSEHIRNGTFVASAPSRLMAVTRQDRGRCRDERGDGQDRAAQERPCSSPAGQFNLRSVAEIVAYASLMGDEAMRARREEQGRIRESRPNGGDEREKRRSRARVPVRFRCSLSFRAHRGPRGPTRSGSQGRRSRRVHSSSSPRLPTPFAPTLSARAVALAFHNVPPTFRRARVSATMM